MTGPTPSIAAIAESLSGYDPASLRVDRALAFLERLAAHPAVTRAGRVPLREALGRVLSDDVVSAMNVPPHDNSAMDGYAFDGAALDGPVPGGAAFDGASPDPTVRLRIAAGTAFAGAAARHGVGPGEALRIMTGAVMPRGLDTVVPQEACLVSAGGIEFAREAVRRGANRRHAGEDLRAGEPALRAGDRLTPAALGLAASIGVDALPVLRRLRVAYFSTGDELLAPGEAARAGAVYDSNRHTLAGLLARLGCEVIDRPSVRDDPAALKAALRGAAREADVILTSGGVSAGDADHTRRVMHDVGDVVFWRIAMQPGRPLAVGVIPREPNSTLTDADADAAPQAVLFGLPGNPVAAMVSFLVFVRPTLLRLMGCNAASREPPPLLRARAAQAIRKRAGRTEYPRGFVRTVPGDWPEVHLAGNQGSGVLSSMAQANALVVLGHDRESVAAGEFVDVMMFDGAI